MLVAKVKPSCYTANQSRWVCGLSQGKCGAAKASQAQRAGYPGWGGLGLRLNPVASHGPMRALWQAKQVWRSPRAYPQSSNSSRFPWEAGGICQQRFRERSLNPGLGKGGGHKYSSASKSPPPAEEPAGQVRGPRSPWPRPGLSQLNTVASTKMPKRDGRKVTLRRLTVAGGRSLYISEVCYRHSYPCP